MVQNKSSTTSKPNEVYDNNAKTTHNFISHTVQEQNTELGVIFLLVVVLSNDLSNNT
jgi:hypothetical protein